MAVITDQVQSTIIVKCDQKPEITVLCTSVIVSCLLATSKCIVSCFLQTLLLVLINKLKYDESYNFYSEVSVCAWV